MIAFSSSSRIGVGETVMVALLLLKVVKGYWGSIGQNISDDVVA